MKLATFKISSIFVALIFLSWSINAAEDVDKSLTVQSDGIVEIHNVRGKIRIVGWNKDKVQVKGELDDLAEELVFENNGKVTVVKIKMPRRNINHGDGTDLVIHIPMGNRIDFNGVSTDLLVEGINGGVDVRSVSGDVDMVKVSKQIFVNSVSGDITLKKSSGPAKLDSISGDIKGELDSESVLSNSVSGDITLHLKKFDEIRATTVSGDVWVSGHLNDSGKVRMSSVNADITLSFDNMINARVNISAGPGGDISNKLSSDRVEEIFPRQQKLNMSLGDGSGSIKIGTVNGSITLRGKKG